VQIPMYNEREVSRRLRLRFGISASLCKSSWMRVPPLQLLLHLAIASRGCRTRGFGAASLAIFTRFSWCGPIVQSPKILECAALIIFWGHLSSSY
jgi:hypothetical protein